MKQQFDTVKMLKYATTENAYRYRPIIRFLYEQYERFKYYSKPEEILAYLQKNELVEDTYTEAILHDDLKQLELWECIITRQDKEVVYTIEEFKNKRLKFQINQPVFEIENTLKKLDDLEEELTGALESREFERILKGLHELYQVNLDEDGDEVIYEKWMNLMKRLENLKRNSTNYLAHLKSETAEKLFKTEAFLLYKEKFVDYLSKFILSMNRNKHKIAKSVMIVEEKFIERYIEQLVDYFSSIPTLDGKEFDREKSRRVQTEKWLELKNWFVKNHENDCDVEVLLSETETSIQIISRYALRLTESKGGNQNRKIDYQHLASMFYECESLNDAHKLAATCFGVTHTKHIYGEEKLTDTQNEEVWEQPQRMFQTTPKNRSYQRNKRIKSYVKASKEERKEQVEQYLKNREMQREVIENLITDSRLEIRHLGEVDSFVRKSILNWITRGVQNKSRSGKTDFGTTFTFYVASDEKLKLRCDDGVMEMPDIVFEFKKGE